MSDNDSWLPVEEREGPYPFEVTRDEAVQFLNEAADRVEQAAAGFQSEWFWQREIARTDLSVGATAWAKMVGPAIAPFLVAELRAAAAHMAMVCMPAEMSVSGNPNIFGIAQHVMAVTA